MTSLVITRLTANRPWWEFHGLANDCTGPFEPSSSCHPGRLPNARMSGEQSSSALFVSYTARLHGTLGTVKK
jgi:hypothetical protein